MHQAVRDIFHAFTAPLEGADVPFMYLDVLGLVTCGSGNLIEPSGLALALHWRRPDGSLATKKEIASAWLDVKMRRDMAKLGGMAFGKLTTLRLTKDAMRELFYRKLDQHDDDLARHFPSWPDMPADAQLGIHSMAWAMGSHFIRKFPKFTAAVRRGDWETAAEECAIKPAKGTVIERNGSNALCFRNAAYVVATGADPSVLIYGSEPETAA